MDGLPEELQLRILEYLDSTPPSELKARQEPSLNLTRSQHNSLKNSSGISKRWRRIALPLLFKHACLRVDRPVRKRWIKCCLYDDTTPKHRLSDSPPLADVDQYHLDMQLDFSDTDGDTEDMLNDKQEQETRALALRTYHASKDFITFVTTNHLGDHVSTFVLLSDITNTAEVRKLPGPLGKKHMLAWRYEASALMWQHLLSVVHPLRVTIVVSFGRNRLFFFEHLTTA